MSDTLPQVETAENDIVIKIPKERMSDFLGDFLKTKRQISKRFPVTFNIKKTDVNNIISLIQYRIEEQNKSYLTDVSIEVLYDDGSSRNYTNLEMFNNVDDNLSAVSVAIFIKLSYLISFRGDETPTKQEINIFASSREMGSGWPSLSSMIESNLIISITTNRFTWAEDVINHFSNYVKGEFKELNRFVKFINRIYFGRVTSSLLTASVPLFVLVLATLFFNESVNYMKTMAPDYREIVGTVTLPSANEKLDILLTRLKNDETSIINGHILAKYALYLGTYIITVFVLPASYISFSLKNYISIGRVSEKANDEKIKRSKTIKYSIIGGVVISVAASVFANYITKLLEAFF